MAQPPLPCSLAVVTPGFCAGSVACAERGIDFEFDELAVDIASEVRVNASLEEEATGWTSAWPTYA